MISSVTRCHWKVEKLSNVATIDRNTVKSEDIRTGTIYVGLEHISGDGNFLSPPQVDEGELNSNKFAFNSSHVLYGKLRPYLKKIARPSFKGICSTDILPISPGPLLERDYLYHYFRQPELIEYATSRCTGVNLPRLSPKALAEFQIPLPPLEEQRRIVEILDLADETRRNQQEIIRLTEEALRSAFLEMFGDPVTNPMGWDIVKLGSVTESKLGKMLSKASKLGLNPVPYLGNSNVRWREFDFSTLQEMDFSEDELQKLNLRDGDLLVCEGGEVGRCAIWRCERERISFQKALHRVRCDPEQVVPEYIQEYFSMMAERGGLTRSTSQATIAHLTGVKLKKLPLPLPPIEQQNRFVALYQHHENMKRIYQKEEEELDILFNALVQAAFRGELTAEKAEEVKGQLGLF